MWNAGFIQEVEQQSKNSRFLASLAEVSSLGGKKLEITERSCGTALNLPGIQTNDVQSIHGCSVFHQGFINTQIY